MGYLDNVVPCDGCGERFCLTHDKHWADCTCPGPHDTGENMIVNEASELVPCDDLSPHPNNPRSGDVGAIRQSIRSNGFYGAVIAQRSTSRILAGEHRWRAAKAEGMEQVPVIFVDCDDDTAVRIVLADNRTNDVAGYDDIRLAELLKEVLEEQDTLDGTGWTDDDLTDLLAYIAKSNTGRTIKDAGELGPDDQVRARIIVLCKLEDREAVYRTIQDGIDHIEGATVE
jgi:ParB-like chromosome segregation protein Spo0J